MNTRFTIGIALFVASFAPGLASAQIATRTQVAVVNSAAPVYLLPDASRTPLRTLPVGAVLTVEETRGEWIRGSFNDQQYGRRVGWIEARFVTIKPAATMSVKPQPPPLGAGPAPERDGIGVRGFGSVAFDRMSAERSFEAIAGSRNIQLYGGGLQITNIWRRLFAELAVERSSVDGERVFVADDDEVFPLGIPVTITQRPLDITAGWRLAPEGRVTPYVGAGVSLFEYNEVSDFDDADAIGSQRKPGFVILAGAEVAVVRWVFVRAEIRYREVKDILGRSGVSAEFGENKLGGVGFAIRFGFGI